MRKINQEECINVNFSKQETNNRPIRKILVEASKKGWPRLSVEILKLANIVHVPQVG